MNVLLIGLGGIGLKYDLEHPDRVQTHARAIAGIKPDLFIAIDPSFTARQFFETAYQGQAKASLAEVSDEIRWDLIVIASPTELHATHLEWACAKQPRLILLEKPVTANETELEKIERIVRETGCRVMVNLIRNYDPGTLEWLGKIPSEGAVTCQVHYSKGLVHNGIHFITLLMKTFGVITETEVLSLHPDRPAVKMMMGRAEVYIIPNLETSPFNGMSIRQGDLELEWVNGGRYLLETQAGASRLVHNLPFERYQAQVLDRALEVMAGAEDDSYALAIEAQRAISRLLNQESSA